MSVQTLQAIEVEKPIPKQIPDYLIYEVSRGKPIYYKGYKDVLNGTKTFEEIMADSTLQGWLKTRFGIKMAPSLEEKGYDIIVGELGIMMPEQGKRAADVAIFKLERLTLNRHYSQVSPDIAIEIDVQADTEDIGEMKYIQEKITEYLESGVEKVIWIFTEAKVFIKAEKGKQQTIHDWNEDVEVLPGVSFNLVNMLEQWRKRQAQLTPEIKKAT
ncbi:MAG: Uma2 family endonuclease [Bacteroidota bacterium]